MWLFGCGDNDHGKLEFDQAAKLLAEREEGADRLVTPERLANGHELEVLFAGFGQLVLKIDSKLHSRGFLTSSPSEKGTARVIEVEGGADIQSLFGTVQGVLGGISSENEIYSIRHDATDASEQTKLVPVVTKSDDSDPPKIEAVAINGANTTAVVFHPSKASRMIHVVMFPTPQQFLEWYADPASETNRPTAHFMLSGRPAQLVANETAFCLRTEAGEVFSWGDARYPRQLCREVDASSPADKPAPVGHELGGLRKTKIAGRGWVFGACTDAGQLFLWGDVQGGLGIQTEEAVTSVSTVCSAEYGQDADDLSEIVDFALGISHLLVLDHMGRVFVAGRNSHGQMAHVADAFESGLKNQIDVAEIISKATKEGGDGKENIDGQDAVDGGPGGIRVSSVYAGDYASLFLLKHWTATTENGA